MKTGKDLYEYFLYDLRKAAKANGLHPSDVLTVITRDTPAQIQSGFGIIRDKD